MCHTDTCTNAVHFINVTDIRKFFKPPPSSGSTDSASAATTSEPSGGVSDESRGGEQTDSPEVQFTDDAEALGAKMVSIEEKIALCDEVFQDLLVVQRIVKEKCLCDSSFVEQKNEADYTP